MISEKHPVRFLFVTFVLVFLLAACGGGSSDTELLYRSLVILHTTDEHSYQLGVGPEADDYPPANTVGDGTITGGAGRRSTILKTERAKAALMGAASLTFSSGDNMMGTLFEAASVKVSPDFRAMQVLGYNASTFGNHDFELSPSFLAAALSKARSTGGIFPIVATNIHFAGTPADASLSALFDETGTDYSKPIRRWHVITAANGIRVGIVGIMGGHAAYDAPGKAPVTFSRAASGRDDDFDGIMEAIILEVQPVVDYLRGVQKVDMVIALGHTGTDPAKPGTGESYEIARNVAGIDVFLSGHTHMTVGPTRVKNLKTGKDVILIESGRYGDHVGKLTILLDKAGNVLMDDAQSSLIPVTNLIPSDTALEPIVDEAIHVLEAEPEHAGTNLSMLERSLSAIEGIPVVHDPALKGDLYFRTLGRTRFALPMVKAPMETPVLRLLSDAFLSVTNKLHPTRVSIVLHGITRDGIWLGKSGIISMADVFRIFPMGQSPFAASLEDYTPGFPIARFAISAFELKMILDMSVATAYASTEGIDYFMMPAGMMYEFEPLKGQVTKLVMASDPASPNTFDTVIYDDALGGWLINPATVFYSIAADYDLAMFAKSKGVTLRNPEDLTEVYPSPPLGAIVMRADGTEQKSYEAAASFIYDQCRLNGGFLPDHYSDTTPQRVICKGSGCI